MKAHSMNFYQNKKILAAAAIVLIVLFFIFKSTASKTGANGIGKVKKGTLIQRVTIAGLVTPNQKTMISAPYNGYVKKIYVKIGDKVKIGDPVVSVAQSLPATEDVYPIRSPLNGMVVQINHTEGEFVRESDAANFILRIDNMDKLFVVANAPEIDRIKVKLGQEAIIKASAILNKTYKGIIRELAMAATEKDQWRRSQVVEFPMKIEIVDPDEAIKPGMSVLLDVITQKKENVLSVRHEFIRKDADKYYVILESGKRQDIEVGFQNEEAIEVTSGLKEGDSIKQVDFSQIKTD